MTRIVLRCVTQGTFVMALIAALSFTPAFAMGYPSFLLRLDAPSSYPRRPGIKATHKIKKNTKESGEHAQNRTDGTLNEDNAVEIAQKLSSGNAKLEVRVADERK